MITVIIILAAFLIVTILALSCCRMAAVNDPCRGCESEDCKGCTYWKEMTHDDG